MEIDHFTHCKHPLIFHDQGKFLECSGCCLDISGPAYSYKYCNFNLHESCTELPFKIFHRSHPEHPLLLSYRAESWGCFQCFQCNNYSPGFTYHCGRCSISLDVRCALIDFSTLGAEDVEREIISIRHFIHKHPLVLNTSLDEPRVVCSACQSPLSGSSAGSVYCCFECMVFLHDRCRKIPRGLEHPFHTHPLSAKFIGSYVDCAICKKGFNGIGFCCDPCDFYIHVPCAYLQMPTLEHTCHQNHPLYYFLQEKENWRLRCKVCDVNCVGSFYRCVICDINFHFECIPLPQELVCKFHKHAPLKFKGVVEFKDYEDGQYCDACELPRKPEYSVYYCEECLVAVEIPCVMAEEGKSLQVLSYMVPKHKTAKIEHFIHKHRLAFRENMKGSQLCKGCNQNISGPYYCCEDCNFYLHKSCTELPFEIWHHSHQQHPLFLTPSPETWECQNCHDKSTGFFYHCGRCSYTIDPGCSVLTEGKQLEQQEFREEQGSDVIAGENFLPFLVKEMMTLRAEVEMLRRKVDSMLELDVIKEKLAES